MALKIIKAESLHDTSMRFRLDREARAVAQIHHPGVVALHDSGELEDGSAFLVMELLNGQDLAPSWASTAPARRGRSPSCCARPAPLWPRPTASAWCTGT